MAYYAREEQETLYRYDPIDERWHVFSTYPPHIRRLLVNADVTETVVDTRGYTIQVSGHVDKNQIRLFKPRL